MSLLTREEAWKRAADCAARADVAFDEDTRLLFLRMRDRWLRIASNPELLGGATVPRRGPDRPWHQSDTEAA
jgi:hypothetical protein